MRKYTAIYDACVLYPVGIRDPLMYLATTELFAARWTDEIHDEWIRNLLEKRPDITRENLERIRGYINNSVPDCLVKNYEHLIEALHLPDPGDRHVLAAAIIARADVIVTYNVKDFPQEVLLPYEIEA
jgi:predicted nucleic acid-binding protein